MRSLVVDVSQVKKPEFVVSVMDGNNIRQICQEMENSVKGYHVVTVSTGKDFVAVDNIAILDAAIKAGVPKIAIVNLGKADSLLTHIEISSQKEMINPARVAIAVKSIRERNKDQQITLNSYLQKVLAVELDGAVISLLADMIDYVFSVGIRQSPPVSYFAALYKLDTKKQILAIQKTQILCQELKQRYFVWPNTHVFKLLLDGVQRSTPQLRESASRNIPSFNCTCGNHYGVINNEICELSEKEGCLIVNKRGIVIHMIPESGAKFLDMSIGDTPKFSMHKSVDDLKKLDLAGPFLLVRIDKKKYS